MTDSLLLDRVVKRFGDTLVLEATSVGILTPRDRVVVGIVALFPIASNVAVFATLGSDRKAAAVLSRALVLLTVGVFRSAIPTRRSRMSYRRIARSSRN